MTVYRCALEKRESEWSVVRCEQRTSTKHENSIKRY